MQQQQQQQCDPLLSWLPPCPPGPLPHLGLLPGRHLLVLLAKQLEGRVVVCARVVDLLCK